MRKTDDPTTYIKYGQVKFGPERHKHIESPVYITAPQCEHIEHDYNRKEKDYFKCPENTMVYNNTCVQADGICNIGEGTKWKNSDVSILDTYYIDLTTTESLNFSYDGRAYI